MHSTGHSLCVINTACVFVLTHSVTPVFTNTPMDLEVESGEDIHIPCKAQGQPEPVITWNKARYKCPLICRHLLLQFS